MKKVFKLIRKNPKEFISLLKEKFSNSGYLCNSHWDEFNGDRYLNFSITENQIWFTFEDDLEGSTKMIMGVNINKPDGILKFKGYAFSYQLEYDWND